MRITNPTITRNYNSNLNKSLGRLNNSMSSVAATGRKIFAMADNTATGVRAMNVRRSLAQIDGYLDNANNAKSKFNTADQVLGTIAGMATSIYERYNYAINGTNSDDEREIIAKEFEKLRDEILTSSNSQYADRYLFGGTNTMSTPFSVGSDGYLMYNNVKVSDIYRAPGGPYEYLFEDSAYVDVGLGMTMQGTSQNVVQNSALKNTINGLDFMGHGENNLYDTINQLIHSLRSGSSDQLTAATFQTADGASAIASAGGTAPGNANVELGVTIGGVTVNLNAAVVGGVTTQQDLVNDLNSQLAANGFGSKALFQINSDTGNIQIKNLTSDAVEVSETTAGSMAYLGFSNTTVEVTPRSPLGGASGYGDLLNKIRDMSNQVTLQRTSIGSDVQYLEYTIERLEDERSSLIERQDSLEFTDMAESIMDLEMQQYVYNASLQMGSRLLQSTLFDYIK